jgi:hypothetical protein
LLADVDDPRATAALERALRDDDASVRAQALDGLAANPGRIGGETILPLLDDPDPAVAASAAAAVSTGPHTADAARVLLRLAADPDPSVRSTALRHSWRCRRRRRRALGARARRRGCGRSVRRADDPRQCDRARPGAAIRGFDDPSAVRRRRWPPRCGSAAVRWKRCSTPCRPAARDAALRALARLDLGSRGGAFARSSPSDPRRRPETTLAAAVPSDGRRPAS